MVDHQLSQVQARNREIKHSGLVSGDCERGGSSSDNTTRPSKEKIQKKSLDPAMGGAKEGDSEGCPHQHHMGYGQNRGQ